MSEENLTDAEHGIFENREQIKIYASALKILEQSDENNPMSVSELMEKISDQADLSQKHHFIYKTLLFASKNDVSRIKSRKGKGGGYFLASMSSIKNDTDTDNIPTKNEIKKEKTLERHIWPLVSLWFQNLSGKLLNPLNHL